MKVHCSVRVIGLLSLCWCAAVVGAADEPVRPAAPSLVVRGASVLDVNRGVWLPAHDIVVAGERIAFVGPSADAPPIPPNTPKIDGRGQYVIPGLIDAHVHLVHVLNFAHVTGDEILPMFIAAGVTSVRSAGEEIVAATAVAHFARSHPERAPRVFTCSPLIDGDPPIHRDIGRPVVDPALVPAFVDEMAHWKVSTLKIYAGTPRAVGKAVIEEGHRHGLMVTAHLGPYRAQDAVADGIDCLEHIWSVFNYIIPPEEAARPDHRATLDLDNPWAQDLIGELARRDVLVDPTLSVFRNMLLLQDLDEVLNHPDNDLIPQRLRKFWLRWTPRTVGPLELRRGEFARYQALTGKMHKAGVTILAGTDTPEPNVPPGFSLHQELEFLVQSGLTPAEVLRAATWNNARAVQQQEHLGSVAEGKLADLVLLTKDPLEDIRNTRSIARVIRGGLSIDPAEVLKLVPRE
ncbi:MAG: amidohydrolase family protein [Planctomycetaceae bacterium]